MALSITPGYEHESGGLATPTRFNTAISGLTINMAAKKLLGTTTEGAAVEIGYADPGLAMLQAETVAAQWGLLGGDLRESATFKQVAETPVAVTISSGVATINLALGTVFTISLTENITSFTISGAVSGKVNTFTLYITQHASAAKTVTWTFTGKTIRGTPPTMTATVNKLDIVGFQSVDGGSTWVPFTGLQNI